MRKIDRFDKYMSFKGLNDNKVTIDLGLSVGTIGKSRKEGRDLSDRVIEQILNFYNDLDKVWLMTGEGEMLRYNSGIIRNNNKGNIYRGDINNNISISLPERGQQKIIDPDGKVTIEDISSGVQNNLNEIDMLNQRIQYLERIVSGHEATIKSLETTIKSKDDLIYILRGSLDKQD